MAHRDHAEPYRLPFTNSCSKVMCLWLICVAWVLREVTAPPQRRVLVRHLNTTEQNSWCVCVCVCVRWCSFACKWGEIELRASSSVHECVRWKGWEEVVPVVLHAWTWAFSPTNAATTHCSTGHSRPSAHFGPGLKSVISINIMNLWMIVYLLALLLLFELVRLRVVWWAKAWGEGLLAPCVPVL